VIGERRFCELLLSLAGKVNGRYICDHDEVVECAKGRLNRVEEGRDIRAAGLALPVSRRLGRARPANGSNATSPWTPSNPVPQTAGVTAATATRG